MLTWGSLEHKIHWYLLPCIHASSFCCLSNFLIVPQQGNDIFTAYDALKEFLKVTRRVSTSVEVGVEILGFEPNNTRRTPVLRGHRCLACLIASLSLVKKIFDLASIPEVGTSPCTIENLDSNVFGCIRRRKILVLELVV